MPALQILNVNCITSSAGESQLMLFETVHSLNLPILAAITTRAAPHSFDLPHLNLITGNKYQREVDFQAPGSELAFTRHYNCRNVDTNLGYGHGWTSTYSVVLYGAGEAGFDILQSNGRLLHFRQAFTDAHGRVLYRAQNPRDGYVLAPAQSSAPTTDPPLYRWQLPDGRVLSFQGSSLVRIDWPDQRFLRLYYRGGRIESITDQSAKVLRLHWTPGHRALANYDAGEHQAITGHLDSITLPDGSRISYDYDAQLNHLTGITDRTGNRSSSWRYNDSGLATSSEHKGYLLG